MIALETFSRETKNLVKIAKRIVTKAQSKIPQKAKTKYHKKPK